MTTLIFITILLIHWIADFCLQTEKQGMNKSSSIKYLLQHTGVYSLAWLVPSFLFLDYTWIGMLYFVGITFIAHTITDYTTSRITKKLYMSNRFYGFGGFWSIIGLDQALHLLQLFLTYRLLV